MATLLEKLDAFPGGDITVNHPAASGFGDVRVMLDAAQQNKLEAYERGVIRDMWVPVIIERAPLHPKKGAVEDGRHNGRDCGGFLIQHETTSSNTLTPPEKLQASQIA